MPVRLVLVATALVAAAWLAASLRASDLESRAQEVVDRVREDPPPAELERAIADLRDARSFNADKEPLVNEALLLWQAGRLGDARARAERVVADEPRNVEGWFALWAVSAAAREPERARQAMVHIRALDPLRANALERFDPRAPGG
jgi:hypothetical protein